MELVVENISEIERPVRELTDYEFERGKPMPNLTHGALQANILIQIALKYSDLYRLASEVALATQPTGTTPDIVLYPNRELNFVNELPKQTEAPLLSIEIESPSQSMDEMIDKVHHYFDFGVKSCWLVVPAMKGIAVYKSKEQFKFYTHEDTLVDSVMNIEIDLGKVFK